MKPSPPPKAYRDLSRTLPDFMSALERMGIAAREAGPLDAHTIALVKLAYGIGAGLEGAAHSQASRALEAGCTKEELLHVALLAAPTIGFPAMVRGRGWVLDAVTKKSRRKKAVRRKATRR
ncbi:MAG: carboxymuconolactone decarboxylase family protein [Planctomycetota bacterium]